MTLTRNSNVTRSVPDDQQTDNSPRAKTEEQQQQQQTTGLRHSNRNNKFTARQAFKSFVVGRLGYLLCVSLTDYL